ncbi:MAG: type II toxin-antitoxin system VapC family toxin [Candidatus Binatia bacterium]
MRALLDTSVLVAAVVAAHPVHGAALPWLQRAKRREFEFFVAAHTIAELYSVLSTLPVRPRISPAIAWRLISENVIFCARLVPLSEADYRSVVKAVADHGLSGGIVFDALIARAAEKRRVDRLVTLNVEDFRRVWPSGADVVGPP